MITGRVDRSLEAFIRLPVIDATGREHEVEAVLDTGFNGSLTLPPPLGASLGLVWRTTAIVFLANGAREECDVYAATISWDGVPRHVTVQVAETTPLIGMGLLSGYRVRIDVVAGGQVIIQQLG